jgi:hypothetical protein
MGGREGGMMGRKRKRKELIPSEVKLDKAIGMNQQQASLLMASPTRPTPRVRAYRRHHAAVSRQACQATREVMSGAHSAVCYYVGLYMIVRLSV